MSIKVCPLSTRQTHLLGFYMCEYTETTICKQYVAPRGHTILIPRRSATLEQSTPIIQLRRTWGKECTYNVKKQVVIALTS